MAKIYIIRHGETDLNKKMALQGRSDSKLNERGIDQAKAAGEFFRVQGICFDHVFTSPLERAVKTAELVHEISGTDILETEIVTDERLLEMDYGPYEGITLEAPPPEIITFFSDFKNNPAPEGMESLAAVTERLGEFLEEIGTFVSGNVLISTHAIAMKGALEYLTPESDGAYWSKNIGNCAVYVCEYKHGEFTVPVEFRR